MDFRDLVGDKPLNTEEMFSLNGGYSLAYGCESYVCATRKTKPSFLPFGIIERMIREARELNIRDVLITGGDFFMYEKWEDLLKLLIHENYKPDLISTKVPINKATIASFSKFNIRLQISLDSNTSSIASKVLGVSRAYTAKMRNSIYDIDKTNIRYQIATVLTSFNDSLIELEKLAFFHKNSFTHRTLGNSYSIQFLIY